VAVSDWAHSLCYDLVFMVTLCCSKYNEVSQPCLKQLGSVTEKLNSLKFYFKKFVSHTNCGRWSSYDIRFEFSVEKYTRKTDYFVTKFMFTIVIDI